MIRWGLCCLVLDAPIRFRSATHAYVWQLSEESREAYLNGIALENAKALIDVLRRRAMGGTAVIRAHTPTTSIRRTYPSAGA